ncbi:MAG: tetratricopeptide repeat protein [Acidimicrobiales bacterium]|nr:tetratricopeptide repeat protein [Acidimicrobiales bacterium]|tara:strand:- start:2368 stop:3084 length:717 start_codon:yes stop_codon:yes gene_type:complete
MDVTDATFQAEVLDRSAQVPVVVDLWAPWCGPCTQLGPILEKVVGETGGRVILAKVNVDENPGIAQAFQAQSIPAVHAIVDGRPADSFMGAQGEAFVRDFVTRLLSPEEPSPEEPSELERLLAVGDEASLRAALEAEPDHPEAVVALAALLVERDDPGDRDEALVLIAGIPETPETRHLAALVRTEPIDDIEGRLAELLGSVKSDDEVRQAYVDLLDILGPDDPRTAEWRRRLASALF